MIKRREILRWAGTSPLIALLPGASFARAETDARLVLVILRGAVDGLAWVAPYGEGKYRRLRGELALPSPGDDGGMLKLDGLFSLHPAMSHTFELYQRKEVLIAHAVATPYRQRSHFDGQDVLENGAGGVGQRRDGWLNRALEPLGGTVGEEMAIAISQNTPLVLRGDSSVTSWSPSRSRDVDIDTLDRIEGMYADDEFFALRLAQALESQQIAAGMGNVTRSRRGSQLGPALAAAASFLRADGGPRIAVVEAGGWDTHANQGAARGILANRFRDLDAGIAGLQRGLGDAWSQTVVAVVTEFGRTVRVNGTRGTDHGTAGAALLLGGAVAGGRVVADWPGIADNDLFEARDLYPTTDIRSIFKGILADHLAQSGPYLDRVVFPDSHAIRAMEGLIRT